MTSNIGEVGVGSIRIKGQTIDELPLGLGNQAKEQLPDAIEAERIEKIKTVAAKYPTHRIDYLVSRINECRENIKRVNDLRTQQETMISEYKGHISMCKHRDKLLESVKDSPNFKEEKKALFKQFPPYDVDAMEQQIVQCREAIQRTVDVTERENLSIEEFSEVHALCKQRDIELAQLGAKAEG